MSDPVKCLRCGSLGYFVLGEYGVCPGCEGDFQEMDKMDFLTNAVADIEENIAYLDEDSLAKIDDLAKLAREEKKRRSTYRRGRRISVHAKDANSQRIECDDCGTLFTNDKNSNTYGGVIFEGWIFARVDENGYGTGGLLGHGQHAGPHAYCRSCFEKHVFDRTFGGQNGQ